MSKQRITPDVPGAEGATITWDVILDNRKLQVEIPNPLPTDGVKESFVGLLDKAEGELGCTHVIIHLQKSRADLDNLVQTFLFMGFSIVTPEHLLHPQAADVVTLSYTCNLDSN